MKKQIFKFFLTISLLIIAQNALADVIQDYRCTSASGNRGPMAVVSAGLGVADGAPSNDYTSKSISFCDNQNRCWASNNYIDTAEGRADYATLLTAVASGSKITFYCASGEYAKNIRLYRGN